MNRSSSSLATCTACLFGMIGPCLSGRYVLNGGEI